MEQTNSPRKTRSGKVLGGAGLRLAGVEMARVEEIIGREMGEDFIDLTQDYIDVDDYDGENGTIVEVFGGDDDNDIIVEDDMEDDIGGDDDNDIIVDDDMEDDFGGNGQNMNHSLNNDLNLTVDLTNSPKKPKPSSSSGVCSSTSASSSFCVSTSSSNGSSSVSCRICLDFQSDLEKEGHHLLSTVCGHIFCSKCLPTHIKKRGLCPICRRVLRPKDFHQIFL